MVDRGSELGEQRVERVVASIASQLIAADSVGTDEAIRFALAQLGEACKVDRAYLIAFGSTGASVEMAAEWCATGVDPVAADLFGMQDDTTRWWSARVLLGEPIFIADVAKLEPDDEAAERLLRAQGVGSLLLVPIVIDGEPRGAIGMTTVRRTYQFHDDLAAQLRLVGQTFINGLIRARAEQDLATAHAELAQRNADLERSNRDLEEFAYVASHDLKSPLLVIRGFLDLLARNKADVLGDDGITFIEAATRGAERMEGLIDALLAFSRAGRSPLAAEPVDLGDVLHRQVLADLDVLLRDAGADVTVGPLPTIDGDRVQLAQLFQNLIANSVKHRHPDRVPAIAVTADRVGVNWHVAVRDNGVGIAPGDASRIFLMFSRLDAARDTTGSGIGLAICQRVAQAHGGRIWVEPADDGGSTFVVSLPVTV